MGNMYTDPAVVVPLSADRRFLGASLSVLDYWKWSGSSLVDNTARGMLAEFLVAAALDVHKETPRIEWTPYDLKTPDGVTIEVKSAATVQSWSQKRGSQVAFGIAPRKPDSTVTESDGCSRRQADIYVFCVWRPDDPLNRQLAGDDTLNVDEWTFYVLRTAELDKHVPKQKTIGETSLLKLKPKKCCYRDLRDAIAASAPVR